MTKPEMVNLISERANISKKAATSALNAFVLTIQSSLQEGNAKIRVSDLGTFRVAELSSRKGVNPRTGKPMTIPATRVPRFSAAKALKDSVQRSK